MPLAPLPPTDTRPLFRPVSSGLTTLLRSLETTDWLRPTLAGTWLVRDVVAHVVDLMLRRLSFHRDGMAPPPPKQPIASDRDFVTFINRLNAEWVEAARRLSPRVLTDLCDKAGAELSDWFEALPLEAPALFGVSWAGEQTSEGWFDVGREFVELWHHQQQVRLAVNAPPLPDPRYLRAVIEIALRALPHAFRDARATAGDSVTIAVVGQAGGTWSLVRDPDRWRLYAGQPDHSVTRVTLSDDTAWRLLCNALPREQASVALQVDGRADLAAPLAGARAVIV